MKFKIYLFIAPVFARFTLWYCSVCPLEMQPMMEGTRQRCVDILEFCQRMKR
jgi:hypothetical protein